MKKNSVGWFEIYVNDLPRAQAFYEGVFEKKLEKLDTPMENIEMVTFPGDMDSYGANGALVKMEAMPAGNNSVLVYFSCDDCATEEARVANFGGKVQTSKTSIGPYGNITIALDTEGNMFGLHSMK